MSISDRVHDCPSAEGLDGIDYTGVIKGNADIEPQTTWSPPGEPERPALPGHEHKIESPRIWPWLTESRAWALVMVLGIAGAALGYSDFNERAAEFDRPFTFGRH